MIHDLVLFAHVMGAIVILGTGAGIAFFMVVSHRSGDPALVAHVAGIVVIADTVFTATAAVLQPITGYVLARMVGWPLLEGWVGLSLLLYAVAGAFWLPVVAIQIRMRDLARTARDDGAPLAETYHRLYRVWFICGFPAFFAMLAIVWLMLTKPGF